jgi:hypothetical protein
MSGFSAGKLPFTTEAARELMSLARPDYELAIGDLIAENKGVFALTVFTISQVKEYLNQHGHRMSRNGLEEALSNSGYFKHSGHKTVEGKSQRTPIYFSLTQLDDNTPSKKYDYYLEGLATDRQLSGFLGT